MCLQVHGTGGLNFQLLSSLQASEHCKNKFRRKQKSMGRTDKSFYQMKLFLNLKQSNLFQLMEGSFSDLCLRLNWCSEKEKKKKWQLITTTHDITDHIRIRSKLHTNWYNGLPQIYMFSVFTATLHLWDYLEEDKIACLSFMIISSFCVVQVCTTCLLIVSCLRACESLPHRDLSAGNQIGVERRFYGY